MDAIDNNTTYELPREFPVTQHTLFNAFINEATLKAIWGVSSISVDARPNDKLRWVVHFDRFPSKETRVTLWFKTTPGGAKVTIRMENFETPQERDANRQAWEGALRKLESIIGKQ